MDVYLSLCADNKLETARVVVSVSNVSVSRRFFERLGLVSIPSVKRLGLVSVSSL